MCAQRVWRIAASQDALQGADRKRCASAEATAPRVFGKSLQSAAIRLQCRTNDIGQKLIIFEFENDAALLRAAAQRKCRVIEKRICGQTGAEIAVKGDADVSGRVDERHAAVTHDGTRTQQLCPRFERQFRQQRPLALREHPITLSGKKQLALGERERRRVFETKTRVFLLFLQILSIL